MKTNEIITEAHLQQISAYIAENSKFTGVVRAQETEGLGLKVDGTIEGAITMPKGGVVHIGPTGNVVGKHDGADAATIEADHIYIEGTVHGKVVARKGIELSPSASVKGEILYHEGISMHTLAKVRAAVNYAGEL